MMKRQLSILYVAVSVFLIACNGKPDAVADNASDGSNTGGGSVAHIDSLKTIATGTNSQNSNTLGTKDSLINGRLVTMPSDSIKNKYP
jgi:hypothetical protein